MPKGKEALFITTSLCNNLKKVSIINTKNFDPFQDLTKWAFMLDKQKERLKILHKKWWKRFRLLWKKAFKWCSLLNYSVFIFFYCKRRTEGIHFCNLTKQRSFLLCCHSHSLSWLTQLMWYKNLHPTPIWLTSHIYLHHSIKEGRIQLHNFPGNLNDSSHQLDLHLQNH